MEHNTVRISYANEVTLITLSSLSGGKSVAQILTAFGKQGIDVDMISQTAPQGSTVRLSLTISDRDLGTALTLLRQINGADRSLSPEVLPGHSKIAFYDAGMVHSPGAAAKMLSQLSEAGIQIMLVTTSEVDISVLVSAHDLGDALRVLRDCYGVTPEEVHF